MHAIARRRNHFKGAGTTARRAFNVVSPSASVPPPVRHCRASAAKSSVRPGGRKPPHLPDERAERGAATIVFKLNELKQRQRLEALAAPVARHSSAPSDFGGDLCAWTWAVMELARFAHAGRTRGARPGERAAKVAAPRRRSEGVVAAIFAIAVSCHLSGRRRDHRLCARNPKSFANRMRLMPRRWRPRAGSGCPTGMSPAAKMPMPISKVNPIKRWRAWAS